MKVVTVAIAFSLAAGVAQAQTRPLTTAMSCQAASALVRTQGAAVLATSRDHFDRYVSEQTFCGPAMMTRAAFVRAADNPQCFIGFTCYAPSYDR